MKGAFLSQARETEGDNEIFGNRNGERLKNGTLLFNEPYKKVINARASSSVEHSIVYEKDSLTSVLGFVAQ